MNKNAIRHKLIVLAVLPLASSFANAGSYDDRIQPYALLPYTEQGYPKTVREFRSRLPEIEAYRRKIAEIALDRAVAGAECNTVIELKLEHHAA